MKMESLNDRIHHTRNKLKELEDERMQLCKHRDVEINKYKIGDDEYKYVLSCNICGYEVRNDHHLNTEMVQILEKADEKLFHVNREEKVV